MPELHRQSRDDYPTIEIPSVRVCQNAGVTPVVHGTAGVALMFWDTLTEGGGGGGGGGGVPR